MLDVLVVLAGFIVLVSLWFNNVEVWTSTCAYKREMGMFAYFSYADVTNSAGSCGELGVNGMGLIATIVVSLSVIFILHYFKSKLAKDELDE